MDGHEYTARFEAPGGKPVLKVYADPLTGKEPWTVGIGHTGPDVKKGATWTPDRCMAAYYNDYAVAQGQALHIIGSDCWAHLNDPRRAVLIDLAFNLGSPRLSGFVKMLDAIRAEDWKKAKAELLDSVYAAQVPKRANTNASVFLTGLWPEDQPTV